VQASHLEPSGATMSFRCRRSSSSPHQSQVIQYIEYNNQQRPNPKKHGVWDPMQLELTITPPFVKSRVDSNTCTMGNPLPESTLTLCQSQLYPPDRDLGFGLSPCYRSRSIQINTRHGRKLSLNTRPAFKNTIMPAVLPEKVSQCV
jgi:hypothetical protein